MASIAVVALEALAMFLKCSGSSQAIETQAALSVHHSTFDLQGTCRMKWRLL
jgi:hypothetical protein